MYKHCTQTLYSYKRINFKICKTGSELQRKKTTTKKKFPKDENYVYNLWMQSDFFQFSYQNIFSFAPFALCCVCVCRLFLLLYFLSLHRSVFLYNFFIHIRFVIIVDHLSDGYFLFSFHPFNHTSTTILVRLNACV